jgi:hypothetical protein
MLFPSKANIDALKRDWTDRYVRMKPGIRPEYKRFEGRLGRVVTVNYSARAVVDFADGAWYDISDFCNALEIVTAEEEIKKFNNAINSAQKSPSCQS